MAEKCVLIIEPDEKFGKALKLYFRGSSYDPIAATALEDARDAVGSRRPDAILVALEEDSELSRAMLVGLVDGDMTRDRPIIVMSKLGSDQLLFPEGIRALGGTAFIKKPFIKKVILKLLDDVVAGVISELPVVAVGDSSVDVELGTIFNEMDDAVENFFDDDISDGPSGANHGTAMADVVAFADVAEVEELGDVLSVPASPAQTAADFTLTVDDDLAAEPTPFGSDVGAVPVVDGAADLAVSYIEPETIQMTNPLEAFAESLRAGGHAVGAVQSRGVVARPEADGIDGLPLADDAAPADADVARSATLDQADEVALLDAPELPASAGADEAPLGGPTATVAVAAAAPTIAAVNLATAADNSGSSAPARFLSQVEPTPGESVSPDYVLRLRQRVGELEEDLRQKSEDFKAAIREKERVEQSVGRKEAELVERIQGLERQNTTLEEDVKKRKQLVAQMTASVQQLTDDLDDKDRKQSAEIAERQTQLSAVQTELDAQKDMLRQRVHELEDHAEELARRQRRIADLEAERKELQSSLAEMTASRDLSVVELRTERSRMAEARKVFESGFGELSEVTARETAATRQLFEQGLQRMDELVALNRTRMHATLAQGARAMLADGDANVAATPTAGSGVASGGH